MKKVHALVFEGSAGIDVSGLPAGFYFAKVKTDAHIEIRKIIKN
jgi:hypothetical protein